MALSFMAAKDEDAMVCDFAQYYGIHDYRAFKPSYAAVLAAGLPEGARIKKLINNQRFDIQTMLLAHIVDYVALDVWFQTKDGHKGRNRPKSIVAVLNGTAEAETNENQKVFASAEDFEAERRRILKEIQDG